jgi:hypothetical protein
MRLSLPHPSGDSFFGMVFVILSGGRKTATFAAVAFTFASLVSLSCYSPNRVMIYLCQGYDVTPLYDSPCPCVMRMAVQYGT